MLYRFIVLVGRAVLRLLGLRRHVVGAEHLPATGGAVLAITHFSYLDFVVTGWLTGRHGHRLVRFLATASAFRHPVAGPLMRGMRHIPVERDGGGTAYRVAVQRLRDGELVGVFPESRVTRSFTLLPFKAGAARMAAQAGVPLVPVVIWGTHRVSTRTHGFSLREAYGTPVEIRVGVPLRPAFDEDPQIVTEQLRAAMAALLDEAQASYPARAAPGAWWQPAHLGGGAPTPEEAIVLDAEDRVVRRQTPVRSSEDRSPSRREAS